jgi:hypothetical protein
LPVPTQDDDVLLQEVQGIIILQDGKINAEEKGEYCCSLFFQQDIPIKMSYLTNKTSA